MLIVEMGERSEDLGPGYHMAGDVCSLLYQEKKKNQPRDEHSYRQPLKPETDGALFPKEWDRECVTALIVCVRSGKQLRLRANQP